MATELAKVPPACQGGAADTAAGPVAVGASQKLLFRPTTARVHVGERAGGAWGFVAFLGAGVAAWEDLSRGNEGAVGNQPIVGARNRVGAVRARRESMLCGVGCSQEEGSKRQVGSGSADRGGASVW